MRRRLSIRGNRSSIISNNQIFLGDAVIVLPPTLLDADPLADGGGSEAEDMDFGFAARIISDVRDRAVTNVELLERVLHVCQNSTRRPTIRLGGLFTSFASGRGRTTSQSDYATLMLRERNLISTMIRDGYELRILASLDIPAVLSSWGYNETALEHRLMDLMEQLNRFAARYPNLRFSVDTHNRLPGQFIFGRALLVRSLVATPGVGYSVTVYDTSPVEIANAVRTFDDAFTASLRLAQGMRSTLQLQTVSDYTALILRRRLDEAGLSLDIRP
jgi:hypothetical protein